MNVHYSTGYARRKTVCHAKEGGRRMSLCGVDIGGDGIFWTAGQALKWLTLPELLHRGCKRCVVALEGRL